MRRIVCLISIAVLSWTVAADPSFSYGYGVVNAPNLRLRRAPNLDAQVLLLLEEGRRVHILEVSEEPVAIDSMVAHWYRIDVGDGLQGWSYGYFIDPDRSEQSLSRILGYFEGSTWTNVTLGSDRTFHVFVPCAAPPDEIAFVGRRRGLPDLNLRVLGRSERFFTRELDLRGDEIVFYVRSADYQRDREVHFRPYRDKDGIDLWDIGEGHDFYVLDRYRESFPVVLEGDGDCDDF